MFAPFIYGSENFFCPRTGFYLPCHILGKQNFFVPLPIWLTDSTMYFFCENQLRSNSHEHCVQLSPLGAMPRLRHTFVGRNECRVSNRRDKA